MSYINYLNAFWQLRQDEFIAPTEADLYFALLQIANLTKWEDEFTASLGRLESMTDMSRHTIIKARNRLVELGLITFEQGTKGRGKNATYTLLKGAEKSAIKCANKKCNIAPFNSEKGAEKSADLHLLSKEKKESFSPHPLYKEKKEIYKEKKDSKTIRTRTHEEPKGISELREIFLDEWAREKLMKEFILHDAEVYLDMVEEILAEWAITYGEDLVVDQDRKNHFVNKLRIKNKERNANNVKNNQAQRRTTNVSTFGADEYGGSF